MIKMRIICFTIATVSASGAHCSENYSKTCDAHCEFIGLLTQQIAGGGDENMRGDLAEDLAQYLQNYPQCGNDEAVVKDITKFLTDGNEAVKAGAAQALANIGPPAKSAIHSLEQALRQAEEKEQASEWAMSPSLSVAGVIRNALEHIKGPARSKSKE